MPLPPPLPKHHATPQAANDRPVGTIFNLDLRLGTAEAVASPMAQPNVQDEDDYEYVGGGGAEASAML